MEKQEHVLVESEKRKYRVKRYGIVIGLISAVVQHLIYMSGHTFAQIVGNTPILPKIPDIDDAIPLLSIFVIPYVWAYLYWAMAPMAASKCKNDHFKDFMAAYLIASLMSCAVLTFMPTYMDRVTEGLWDIPRNNFCDELLYFWYCMDGHDLAYNLFPSVHCLNSTLAYLAVAGRKEVKLWFRVYSLLMTISIYIATVCVKQHYFIDIFGGMVIAIIAFAICKHWHVGRMWDPFITLWNKVFKTNKKAEE